MTPASETSLFRRLVSELHERKAWEAKHPELAQDWTEAKHEDAQRQYAKELADARASVDMDAPHLLKKLGVPPRAADALQRLDPSMSAIQGAKRWLAVSGKPFLWLMGGPGVGKTVAAAYVALDVLRASAGHSRASGGIQRSLVRWVHAVELASLSSFDEGDRALLEDCMNARLLVLDDFASENPHREALPRLERLINHRYERSLRTVATSNMSEEGLRSEEMARMTDRLREVGMVHECGNRSLRGVKP